MRVHRLLADDDAVSAVVGVVLLVAVTVILATVVATGVLGGVSTQSEVPNSRITFDYNADGKVDLTHQGGDSFTEDNAQRVSVKVDGPGVGGSSSADWLKQAGGEISPGDQYTVFESGSPFSGDLSVGTLNESTRVRAVWVSPSSTQTQVVAKKSLGGG